VTLRKSELDNIMRTLTDKLSFAAHGRLQKVILYGSYARGDYKEYSDVDVMFLVDMLNPEVMYPVIKPDVDDFSLEHLVTISCRLQNYTHFYDVMACTSFYKNVEREGVVYYDRAKQV